MKETFADIKTDGENPILLHSDQGFQYTSRLYERLTAKYGIMPSMSRKGNCFDNAAAENFFSHLKSELINRVKLKDYEETKKAIDDYIRYYNNERIQVKLKMAPLEYWNTGAISNRDCVRSTCGLLPCPGYVILFI